MRFKIFLVFILTAATIAVAEAPVEIERPEISVRDSVLFTPNGEVGKVISIKREKGVNIYSLRIRGVTYVAIRNQLLARSEYVTSPCDGDLR